MEELGIELSEPEGSKTPTTRISTESTNLGSWGLTKSRSLTREHAGTGRRLPKHL